MSKPVREAMAQLQQCMTTLDVDLQNQDPNSMRQTVPLMRVILDRLDDDLEAWEETDG